MLSIHLLSLIKYIREKYYKKGNLFRMYVRSIYKILLVIVYFNKELYKTCKK